MVSSTNSIVGKAGERVGSGGVTALSNGNYVVSSPGWKNGSNSNAGAVTWINGATGTTDVVSSTNSLVGSQSEDRVGSGGVTALSNGNYVVSSPSWGDVGATTWGKGITGISGNVTVVNSQVGTSATSVRIVVDYVNGHYASSFPHEGNGRVRLGSVTDGYIAVGSLFPRLLHGQYLDVTDVSVSGVNNDLSVVRSGDKLVLHDPTDLFIARPFGCLLGDNGHSLSIPLSYVRSLSFSAAGGTDLLTLDLGGGVLPFSIGVNGGNQPGDALVVIGNGDTIVSWESPAYGLFSRILFDGAHHVSFEGIRLTALTDLLAMNLVNANNFGTSSLTVEASSITELGTGATLAGGSIHAPGGVFIGGAQTFRARGVVNSPLVLSTGGTLTATGALSVGDAYQLDGFHAGGRLLVNNYYVTLLDLNEAVLGSSTVLGTSTANGTLSAPAGLLLGNGTNLSGRGTVSTSAGVFRNDGHVLATTGLIFTGMVTGTGDFRGPVSFKGGSSFGHGAIRTVVQGAVTLGSTNTHQVDLAGFSPGSGYDQLDVSGATTVNGTLQVGFAGMFTARALQVGDSFEIVRSAGGVTGRFSTLDLPPLAPGMNWKLSYLPTSVVLSVVQAATSGSDSFQLLISSTGTTILLSVNGGPVQTLGFVLNGSVVTIPGLTADDSVQIIGTSAADTFAVSASGLKVNSVTISLPVGPSRILAGQAGNDVYQFDADTVLGNWIIEDTAGIDCLDFYQTTTTGVSINLASDVAQTVSPRLNLQLRSAMAMENVIGTPLRDVISGNSLANKLEGRDGNDQLTGLTGSDRLIGGNGDDSYGMTTATTAETDTLFEAVDGGRDTVTFAAVTVNVTLDLSLTTTQALYAYMRLILNSATDFEAVLGGSGNDRLKGNDEANSLSGGLGNDVLEGAGGNDQLIGGSGDDIYIFRTAATAEADRVTESASSGIDTLDFSSLTTAVHLNLGAIAIQTVHSNRTLTLNSGSAFENAASGSADDTLQGNSAANVMVGHAGNDNLTGLAGRDMLIGGDGADTVNGGADDDILVAGTTTYDALFSQLNELRTVWIGSDSYSSRITAITTGAGVSSARLKPGVTVIDDTASDGMNGGIASDWFLRALDDVLTRFVIGETDDLL